MREENEIMDELQGLDGYAHTPPFPWSCTRRIPFLAKYLANIIEK
jgi:hypothetical protein